MARERLAIVSALPLACFLYQVCLRPTVQKFWTYSNQAADSPRHDDFTNTVHLFSSPFFLTRLFFSASLTMFLSLPYSSLYLIFYLPLLTLYHRIFLLSESPFPSPHFSSFTTTQHTTIISSSSSSPFSHSSCSLSTPPS